MSDKGGTPTREDAVTEAPTRSPEEVMRDITGERAALEQSFERLQSEVEQTVEQIRHQVLGVARAALIVGPLAGFAVGGLIVGAVLLARRRGQGD
jgi:hypothetical protein